MDEYAPRIIIQHDMYDDYLLDLHRTLGYMAENRDPPNPFRGLIEEGDNLKIAINDTNDLHFCIKHFERKILDGELESVIIGDPHTFGYGLEILDKMCEDLEVPVKWSRDKRWITVMLNTSGKLVIEHGKIRVEK
jgi:hypothetical protein